jgi:hypothetical protein
MGSKSKSVSPRSKRIALSMTIQQTRAKQNDVHFTTFGIFTVAVNLSIEKRVIYLS